MNSVAPASRLRRRILRVAFMLDLRAC